MKRSISISKAAWLAGIVAVVTGSVTGLICHNRMLQSKPPAANYAILTDSLIWCARNFEVNNLLTGIKQAEVELGNGKTLSALMKEKNKPVLVLRITELNCGMCVENSYRQLEEFRQAFGDQVLILATYSNTRILRTFNYLKIPSCHISYEALDWAAEEDNAPYYFVLHPDMKVSSFFIPEKRFPERSTSYLTGIRSLIVSGEILETRN